MSAEARLVVVSNRLPLTLKAAGDSVRAERSAGGLATALGPIVARTNGLWLGWPGDAGAKADSRRDALLAQWTKKHRYVAVDLPHVVARRFYEGFANQTLWPLFHLFPSRMEFDPASWDAYLEANERFRDALLDQLQPGDRVWIHDYHLMLLPGLLREAAPEASIGFFLHIPFPPGELFRLLPRREELLRGLLGADLLGFQTHGHLQHFRRSLLRVLGMESRMDRVPLEGRFARLGAHPIGIAAQEFIGVLDRDADAAAALADLRARYQGQRILLGVDRLDYTKGIPERLRTYQRLLERAPHLRGKVVLVQVAVPSRERIARYAELRRQVAEIVGEINGAYGTPGWTPIVYVRRGISRPQLVALYAAADVAWVTPLRDGMNLVAKEYVACQGEGTGALVLSEFAGAAAEMGEAFLVNPYDEARTAEVLERVLDVPADERAERLTALRQRVLRNDAFAWAERFLKGLDEAATTARVPLPREVPVDLPRPQLLEAWRSARRKLILFDYDGTLVPFAGRPKDARPSQDLVRLLEALVSDPGTLVAVVSGRPRADLAGFLGELPRLWLAAEHGALLRGPGGEWQTLRPGLPAGWKGRVRPVLEHFVDRTPGSFVEEKEYALVWHYRLSDPEFGEWLANELTATLDELLAETELKVVRGHKSVEVRLVWAHKGEVVTRLVQLVPEVDFCLAVGDDRTDEDLFASAPVGAWTVHVGAGPSHARFRVAQPSDVVELLRSMVSPLAEAATRHA